MAHPKRTTLERTFDSPAANPVERNAVEHLAEEVSRELVRNLLELIRSFPGFRGRPVDMCKTLKINKDLASKSLKAVRTPDPVAALRLMPGPDGLRSLTQAARLRGAPRELVEAADASVARFEHLIRDVAGGRQVLDTILSRLVPESREKAEVEAKRSVFSGMSRVLGYAADILLDSAFLGPGREHGTWDGVNVLGAFGLKRIKFGTRIHFTSAVAHHRPGQTHATTLDGISAIEDPGSLYLLPYCSSPTPEILVERVGNRILHWLGGQSVGLNSSVDVVMASVSESMFRAGEHQFEQRKWGVSSIVEMPAKSLVCDLLVHRSLWPGTAPMLRTSHTAGHGRVDLNNPEHDYTRIDLRENIQSLGVGLSQLRVIEVPDYVEILREVCRKRNWIPEEFHCFRCRVQYPLYGMQVHLAFTEPPPMNRTLGRK